jgi:hypothetical protein
MLDLARLADTLAALRSAQERYHQAQAAVDAATTLRAAASTSARLTRSGIPDRPDPTASPSKPGTGPGAADHHVARPSTRDDEHRPRR